MQEYLTRCIKYKTWDRSENRGRRKNRDKKIFVKDTREFVRGCKMNVKWDVK